MVNWIIHRSWIVLNSTMPNYKTICTIIFIQLKEMIFVFHCRFDVALLIKSFNQLSIDEKQKILKNLLHTVKSDGQIFVYESEWPKDNGKTINLEKKIPKNFSYSLLKKITPLIQLMLFITFVLLKLKTTKNPVLN